MRTIHDWIYSGEGNITQNFRNEIDVWVETDEKIYWDQLECVPPRRMTHKAFMVGEPYTHHEKLGTIYATFVEYDGRYFAKMDSIGNWNPVNYVLQIKEQFGV